jgi:hypothetical protein
MDKNVGHKGLGGGQVSSFCIFKPSNSMMAIAYYLSSDEIAYMHHVPICNVARVGPGFLTVVVKRNIDLCDLSLACSVDSNGFYQRFWKCQKR